MGRRTRRVYRQHPWHWGVQCQQLPTGRWQLHACCWRTFVRPVLCVSPALSPSPLSQRGTRTLHVAPHQSVCPVPTLASSCEIHLRPAQVPRSVLHLPWMQGRGLRILESGGSKRGKTTSQAFWGMLLDSCPGDSTLHSGQGMSPSSPGEPGSRNVKVTPGPGKQWLQIGAIWAGCGRCVRSVSQTAGWKGSREAI